MNLLAATGERPQEGAAACKPFLRRVGVTARSGTRCGLANVRGRSWACQALLRPGPGATPALNPAIATSDRTLLERLCTNRYRPLREAFATRIGRSSVRRASANRSPNGLSAKFRRCYNRPVMEFRILGPLEVWERGAPIELRQRRRRALLAVLLLRAGEIVSVDQLLDDLWGERPPPAAKGSLQNAVSALRKLLGSELLRTQAPGYLLDIEQEQVDLFRFERLLEEARDADQAAERAECLREALALWRGPALADLAFEPFVLLEAPRLEELRLAAQEELIEARLAQGEHADLVAELESLLGEHPFNERLRGQLMLALYRAGRQVEALETYRHGRGLLLKELGLEPSTPLRELEQAILRHEPALAPARPHSLLPMRKTATVLCADLVAAEPLDPELLSGQLDRYSAAAQLALEGHGGTVEILRSGGVLGVFGVPQAHEDDALRALRAAVELREGLQALGHEFEPRIGVDTGEVFVGGPGSAALAIGAVVDIAQRLEESATDGEIMIGPTTFGLVRDAVKVERLEPLGLGSKRPLGAWRLVELIEGAPAIPRRFEAPLVGRRRELAALHAAFEATRTDRRCRLLVVAGEPGIGKTRLAREFLSEVANEAKVLVGGCASYGDGATWLPLREVLPAAGAETPEALSSLLSAEQEDGELVARRIAAAIGLAEEPGLLEETNWAFRRLFETLATQRPLVLVFEDVHWTEPTLLDLIDYLGARAAGPILVLCLTRPELLETRTDWAGPAITLSALPEAEVRALVDALPATLDVDGRARVVEVAEGNPLFAEQLVAHAQEGGSENLDFAPPSIEALLASRLDLLPADELALLQRAALIGRHFAHAALLELCVADPASTEARLRSLTLKGFIRSGASQDSLSFDHALVRDVAYQGISKAERAELHELVAKSLGRANGPDELIGYHLEQAARYKAELSEPDAALAEKASEHLAAAGRRALWGGDLTAAGSLLERALVLSRATRFDIHLELDLASTQEPARAVGIAEAAAARAYEAGDEAGEALARVIAADQRRPAGDIDVDALESLARKALPLLEEVEEHAGLVYACRALGSVASERCRYQERERAAELALRHSRMAGEHPRIRLDFALVHGPRPADEALTLLKAALPDNPHPGSLLNRAHLLAMLGRFEEAWPLAHEANATYLELTGIDSRHILAQIAEVEGDYAAVVGYLRPYCDWCEEHGLRSYLASYAPMLGRSLCALGQHREAEPLADLGREIGVESDLLTQMLWRQVKALVRANRGETARAARLAREAVTIGEQTDDLNTQGNAFWDLAEVLLAASRRKAAAAALTQALERYERKKNLVMAERVRARLAELRLGANGGASVSPAR
jgi:DNA-binding SARP family transcriptional activator